MNMRLLAVVVAVGTAVPVHAQANQAAPVALEPARLAEGRRLIDLMLPPAQREQMITSVVTSMMGNVAAGALRGSGLGERLEGSPRAKRVFADFISSQRERALTDVRANLPGLIEAYAHAYARMFTIDEMRQIEAFLATPAGAKFAVRSGSVLSDPDVSAWQQRMAARESARQQAELERFRADLEAAFAADAGRGRGS